MIHCGVLIKSYATNLVHEKQVVGNLVRGGGGFRKLGQVYHKGINLTERD